MHFYAFNIGDYSSHTSRLTVPEDCAYRRLLDLYYLKERPLKGCVKAVAREIGMSEFLPEIEYVLGNYFAKVNGFWENARCEKEIKVYQGKIKQAKEAGRASGVARRKKGNERAFNGCSTGVQREPNGRPTKQDTRNTTFAANSDVIPFEDV